MKRVKTPTILQMEAVECGAAALAIVLAHFGRWVPLEELRVACGVSRDGSKASNIARAARRYGLTAEGHRHEPEALPSLPLPLIVYWNFNHFVVVEGFGKECVYLNDPATGPRTVSHEEFDRSFTGIVLLCQPGPDFRPGGAKPSVVAALRQRLRGSETALLYVVLVSLLLIVPGLVVPALVRLFVDALFVGGRREWLAPLLLGLGLTAVVRALLVWVQQYYLLRMETQLALSSSSRFFWHVLRLPAEFFTQRYGGEIGSRVAMNDQVARLLSGDLALAVLNVITVGFYSAAMVLYDPALAAIGIFFALLNVMALRHVARRRMDANQRLFTERGKVLGAAMGGLQIIESLKAGGGESDFFARWTGHQANLARAEQELAVSTQYLTAVPPLLAALNTALILAVGGMRVMEGHLTIGTLVALQSLMASFQAPILKLVELGSTFQEVDGSLKRIDDVLRSPTDPHVASLRLQAPGARLQAGKRRDVRPRPSQEPGARSQAPGSGHLELRDVTFGYSPLEPPLLQALSLTVRPGSRVALVGGSGSGKSTVARLVCGLFSPWDGEILLDGVPQREVPRARRCQSLAMVDQEIFLFEGTVRENLTLWNPTVPEADLIRAARDACIHDEISARAGGYDSRVDEGGANFSGGQRQRLEIARALVADPAFLVLDEATSALDPVTEKQIDDHLRRRGCTCLIVAHRLSTIRDCDEILVLERGQVVQRGTHAQMRRAGGPYARLIETRERASRPHLEIA